MALKVRRYWTLFASSCVFHELHVITNESIWSVDCVLETPRHEFAVSRERERGRERDENKMYTPLVHLESEARMRSTTLFKPSHPLKCMRVVSVYYVYDISEDPIVFDMVKWSMWNGTLVGRVFMVFSLSPSHQKRSA